MVKHYTNLVVLVVLVIIVGTLADSFAADNGYDIEAYSGPWAAMHRDNRNSDYAPVTIANLYKPYYERSQIQQLAFNKPVIGPYGDVYYSFQGFGNNGYSQYFMGRSGTSGIRKFQFGFPDVDTYVTSTGGLIGEEGDFFLGDNDGVMRYSSKGVPQWSNKTPIMGVQASGPQFTPDGKLLFMTWNGWIHVIEPLDGSILWEQNMTPDREFFDPNDPDFNLGLIIWNGSSGDCAYVNMPAVDPFSDSIYQTYNDEDGNAYIHKYSYNRATHEIKLEQSAGPLLGGSASSITLSSDYKRLYVNNNNNELVAYITNGLVKVWSVKLFYTPKGSPVVNPNGYIVPNGDHDDPYYKIQVFKDVGNRAIRVFVDKEHIPMTSVSAGLDNRFVVVALSKITGLAYFVVFDQNGIISRTRWGGEQPDMLASTALDEDGSVYVIGFGSVSLKKFVPVE